MWKIIKEYWNNEMGKVEKSFIVLLDWFLLFLLITIIPNTTNFLSILETILLYILAFIAGSIFSYIFKEEK